MIIKNKRAVLKISSIIIGLFAITLLAIYASGVLANTHDSHADLEPEWSTPGETNDYTVTITNDGPDTVDEVRIYKNGLYGGFEDASACEEKTGWELTFIYSKKACHYIAESFDYYIDATESTDFNFSATAPEAGCQLQWKFETRDVNEVWRSIYDYTSIDDTPPTTTKEYGEPFYSDGTYDWINIDTPIILTAVDGAENCAVGVDKLYWRNTLLEIDDEGCIKACQYQGEGEFNEVDGDETTIYKPEESCHLIEFYSVDKLGNTEEINKQCVFVDITPPVVSKEVVGPQVGVCPPEEGDTCYIQDHVTEIRLSCEDQRPHPSDNEKIFYRILLDGQLLDDWTQYSEPVVFQEDSEHTIEYYCEDAVGNSDGTKAKPYSETFKVDSQPPIIEKDMFGSYLGDCPVGTDIEHGDCYVADDGSSGLDITVYDDPTYPDCVVGEVTCEYKLWWDVSREECIDKGEYNPDKGMCLLPSPNNGEFSDYTEIIFTEDSTHELNIHCEDALGNSVDDTEIFLVDSTPPETTKEFIGPNKIVDCNYGLIEWITSETQIILTAEDEKVRADEIYWMNTLIEGPESDLACWEPENYCEPTHSHEDEGWTKYTEPIQKAEESCHILEYYSVDELGNIEDVQVNCFFVDNTPPESVKEHGEPIIPDEGFDWVTQDTQITLDCEDQGDHPVEQESICYKVSLDDFGLEYLTEDYCIEFGGEMNDEDYCCVYVGDNPLIMHFLEDSNHNLEYYCIDHLGNTEEPVEIQWYKVDTEPPVLINKIIEGPQFGDCPPEQEGDICFIDGETSIGIEVEDPEICAVDEVECYWWYWLDDVRYPSSGVYREFPIQFPEESEHELHIKCKDALGNEMIEDIETFYVDKTAPTTTKGIIGPYYEEQGVEWIDGITTIELLVDDTGPHKSGIKETYWRNTLVDDDYCWGELDCEHAEGSGNWNLYEGPFPKDEESCHLIEYYSVDNVDKTEIVNKECIFVDKTSPERIKEIGEPKVECQNEECDLWEWKITKETPITLSCDDIGPHPSGGAEVCWRVWWDKTQEWSDWECVAEGTEIYLEQSCIHELEFYCKDNVEKESEHDSEWIKVEGRPFEIQINKKWNLISVPVVLLNNDPEVVFDGMEECIESVWAWDGAAGEEGEWYVYTLDDIENDNLDEIIPGWGYWIKAKDECNLLIGGDLLAPKRIPPTRDLVPGWNLIGYYGREDVEVYDGPDGEGADAYCALWSLTSGELGLPKWSSLYGYWQSEFEDYSMFAQLDPGAGYWINMKDNQETYIYSPSTICYDWYGGWF